MNRLKKKSHPRKKVIAIIVVIVFVIALSGLACAYKIGLWPFAHSHLEPTNTINYGPPTKDQSTATGSTKQSSNATESTGSDTSPNSASSAISGQRQTVAMTISATNEVSGIFYIRTLIETISSNGTCVLLMSGPNGRSYTATVGVQANPSTSTCQGFNVPVGSLSSGMWHIVVNYTDSSAQASASKDVTIQ